MAIVKEGILLASIKSNSITGITIGSSNVNCVLTEGCRRISVYNVRNFQFCIGSRDRANASCASTCVWCAQCSTAVRNLRLELRIVRDRVTASSQYHARLSFGLVMIGTEV